MTALRSLEGRTAFVTGAGGGVGRGIALALSAAGAKVVIAARRVETGDQVAEEIRARGDAAMCVKTDVSEQHDVEAAIARTIEVYGGLDIVVHNATSGRSTDGTLLAQVPEDLLDDNSGVAARAAFHCARASFAHLKASGRGRFITLVSSAGIRGQSTTTTYSIVKGMERGFVRALAWEWGSYGITVNAVAPLAMSDGMARVIADNPSFAQRIERQIALHRIGDAERDIGPVVVFLASDAAGYMTGQTLMAEGGTYFV